MIQNDFDDEMIQNRVWIFKTFATRLFFRSSDFQYLETLCDDLQMWMVSLDGKLEQDLPVCNEFANHLMARLEPTMTTQTFIFDFMQPQLTQQFVYVTTMLQLSKRRLQNEWRIIFLKLDKHISVDYI